MVNLEFLVVTYFISLSVDWIFQSSWQAINKSKWGKQDIWIQSFVAVFSHSLVYAVLTTIPLIILDVINLAQANIVFYVLFTSHLIIDTRIPVKYILRLKRMSWDEINNPAMGFLHIGIDHRIHELTILVLSIFI